MEKPLQVAQGAEKYLIQVAALRDGSKAKALKDKLSKMGYHAQVDKLDRGPKGKFYRVKLRGYEGRQKANQALAVLEKKLPGSKFLIIKEN